MEELTVRDVVRQKYASLPEGKVLDVSGFRVETKKDGTLRVLGLREAAMPKTFGAEGKGSKKMIKGLKLVSDNYQAYKEVADLLGERKFAQEFYNTFEKVGNFRGEQGKLGRPARKTPVRGPAKSLAEKLQFAVDEAARHGKVVNVSALTDKGGFRTIELKTGYAGRMTGVPELPIVSNNREAMMRALRLLDREDLMEEYQEAPQKGKAGAKGGVKSQGISKNATAEERLADMYQKALKAQHGKDAAKYPFGAQLDISGLQMDGTGTRLRVVAEKPRGAKSKFPAGVENPLDPVLISDNAEAFRRLAAILGPEYDVLAEQWIADDLAGLHRAPERKSPKRSPAQKRPVIRAGTRSRSPSRSRSLSPFPVIGTQSRSQSRSPVRAMGTASRAGRSGSQSPRVGSQSPRAGSQSPRSGSRSPRGLLRVPNKF